MSDVLEPCVGDFHFVPDIIMLIIMKINLVMVKSHEYNLVIHYQFSCSSRR